MRERVTLLQLNLCSFQYMTERRVVEVAGVTGTALLLANATKEEDLVRGKRYRTYGGTLVRELVFDNVGDLVHA